MKGERRKKKDNRKGTRFARNREMYVCAMLFIALFAGLFGYLASYVVKNDETLFNNSYNSRQRVLAQENRRGTIYAAGGEALARSVQGTDGGEIREYPYGEVFAHVVGYSQKGRTGIEELENYFLIQSDIAERKKMDNELAGTKNPGNDVYTTLDVTLQQAAYDALGAYQGAIVVTDVRTGRILAMVSKPDFDPNQIVQIWEQVSTDTDNAALVNRVTQGLYPPGSTFKIVTALAYLRQFGDQWQNYSYQCNGAYTYGESKINCFHGSVHGKVDLGLSFAKSCNSSFANIGMQLNRKKFQDTIDSLLFNAELPIPLSYNKTTVRLTEESSTEDVVQTSIGQGKTQISPMQLNLITAAIANEGVLMRPVLVDSIKSAEGKILEENRPVQYCQLMAKEEAAQLGKLMEEVVQEGTGRGLKDRAYTCAGKTGSAEFNDEKLDSHAWFTGFAPAQDPEIAVTVIVERIGSGGDYAVPLARRVFDAYFLG